MKRELYYLFGMYIVLVLLILGIFVPDTLLLIPNITPLEYLSKIPYTTIGNVIVEKPSETLFVFVLGIQIVVLGYLFLKEKTSEAKTLFGISFVFWGMGALLAGVSYQGLGYEIKCSGETFCLFTSWFELAYLLFTALSISVMAIAIQKVLSLKTNVLRNYSITLFGIYNLILLGGTIFEIRFLISYELFTLFFMPLFVVFFILSIMKYRKQKDTLNKTFITVWILFLVVNVSYYVYYFLDIGSSLYENYNIWFSANDILHVLLILWFLFIQFKLKKEIH